MTPVSVEPGSRIMRWKRVDRDPPPEGLAVEYAENGKLWRRAPSKVVRITSQVVDANAERQGIEAKQE